ncbi:GNAT family N-acetyltransferase [Rhodocyclus tenuis]|uniref:Ribosomal protein S18 acetylase RimI-like enzyme n=1 Tax=Rhodocyclus tenuis TaxID=1066 RepID=A0A840G5T0_RHOTE|nr:GNAT family N-acetyltransferase [Rhodocyclus tenuis]MBB4246088.1 ribosomal protein S18 acetylase RimI-like enzyme [Rhodocyclus tenuis]
MSLVITPLVAADIAEVAALARVVWQATYPGIISQAQIDHMLGDRYGRARVANELATPGIWWDVARVDGVLVGFAASLTTLRQGEMKLDKLYVDPAQQRQGIGGALIDTVVARARDVVGCSTLILAVNKQNSRAITAYDKYGFSVRESVRVDIGNGFVMDDFIMARTL